MIRIGSLPRRNTQNLDIKGMPLVEVGGLGLASQRPIISASLGTVYTMARRYDEAIAQGRETVEMHPDFYWAHRFLGLALKLLISGCAQTQPNHTIPGTGLKKIIQLDLKTNRPIKSWNAQADT